MVAAAEMDRVIVPRSRDASGSSESVRGRVEVRGEGARLAPSTEFDGTGVVTMIVGGWHVDLPLEGVDTVMCRVPWCFLCTGERAIPAAPTRAGRSCVDKDACWSSYILRDWFQVSR